MKMKKASALLLSCVLALTLLAGCGAKSNAKTSEDTSASSSSAKSEAADNGPVTVKDMTKREIKMDKPATRVVALNPADCEILYALGAGDTLVGRGTYCDYPKEVASVPDVQTGDSLSTEQVIALNPELVIMNTMAHSKEQVQALADAGAKVAVSEATDIDGVYTAIDMIGKLVGREKEADALTKSMKTSFADIKKKADGDGTKSVYFEVSPLEYGLWTAGSDTFLNEIAGMLGVKNAFADVSGWKEVSQEQIIKRNPDYIVTIAMYDGSGPKPEDEIMSRSGWENITAVKNKAVYNADNNQTARPGPRLVDAAQSLYDFIYKDKAN